MTVGDANPKSSIRTMTLLNPGDDAITLSDMSRLLEKLYSLTMENYDHDALMQFMASITGSAKASLIFDFNTSRQQFPADRKIKTTNSAQDPAANPKLKPIIEANFSFQSEADRRLSHVFAIDDDLDGILVLERAPTDPAFTERDTAACIAFTRHLANAIRMSRTFLDRQFRNHCLMETIDHLSIGVILVERSGLVLDINKAASALLAMTHEVSITANRLMIRDRRLQAALLDILNASDSAMHDEFERSLAIPDQFGGGIIATIVPLTSKDREPLARPPDFAIYLSSTQSAISIPWAAFGKLYGLSPSELSLCERLATGLAVGEAADKLGISEATARTHVRKIFRKTGVARQPDLMVLTMKCASPIDLSKRPANASTLVSPNKA